MGDGPTNEQLAEMHHEAHHLCYIANSIKSEIVIKAFEG
jgi:organic hydroperoxide reductase OsmC/OhrA